MKSILTTNIEDGAEMELETPKYIEFIAQAFDVKEVESETQGKIPAKKVIKYVIDTLIQEKELDPSIKGIAALAQPIAKIQEDVDRTRANAKSAAEKAKDEKEEKEKAKAEEKAKKEAEAKAAAELQLGFNTKVNVGYDKAMGEFKTELESLKEGLPTSIHIGVTGAGASKAISKYLEENGKRLAPNSIDVYRRLALRTPVEVRNPTVDPSAFLAITQVNPNPKKMDGESDEAFKVRKETLATDLRALQEELKNGTILTRKDMLPKVLEVEYKNGLKTRPTGEDKMSPGKNLLNFFLATLAIEKLDGLHGEPGTIVFLAEDGTNKVEVATEEVEKLREEAFNNLLNIYVDSKKIKAADILRGSVTEMKKVPMGTDGNGKAITEEQPVKTDVHLPIFFKIETTPEGEGDETTEDGGTPAPAETTEETQVETPAEPVAEPAPAKPAAKKTARVR
jgi:hypothetical protein